jgi:tetratricopeptide (TPR) repeat protein
LTVKDSKILHLIFAAAFTLSLGSASAQQDTSIFDDSDGETIVKEFTDDRRRNIEDLDPSTASPRILKKYGKKFFKIQDYYSAIEFLAPYVELNPEDIKRMRMLAEAYQYTRNYREAEDMISRLISQGDPDKLKEPKDLLTRFQMAKSATKNGRDVDAGSADGDLKKFKKQYGEKDKSAQQKIFKAAIAGAKQYYVDGGFARNDSMLVIPLPEEINQTSMELSPIIVDRNTLIFGSLVADTDEFYALGRRPSRNLYTAKFWDDHSWTNEGFLPGPFNEDDYDIVGGAYSFDQERFYFSKCKIEKYKESICAIWKSEYKSGEWTEPTKLNEVVNDPDYSSKYPTLGVAAGRRNQDLLLDVLYFSSDRPKSKGGYDLWYSVVDEKTRDFKKAKSCGSKINTPGEEITPFYNRQTQELFFSSTGHPGFGGHDIFKSKGYEKKFENLPVNVLSPINSPADDYYFVFDNKQDQGFFVSNRIGSNSEMNPTCCDDIFQFRDKNYIEIIVGGQIFTINDSVRSKTGDNFLDGAQVSLLSIQEGGDTVVVEGITPTGEEGYRFDLVQGQNYLIKAEKKYHDIKFVPISTMEYVYSDSTVIDLGLRAMPRIDLHVPRLYYASNEAFFSEETERFLREGIIQHMTEHPELNIHIGGHADDVGNDRYNIKLSKKRAKAVYKFLVKEGIDKERLSYDGYGETRPVQTIPVGEEKMLVNTARDLNRRVEFSIPGESLFRIILD